MHKVYTEGNKNVYEREMIQKKILPADTPVSMNVLVLHQNAFDYIQKLFSKILTGKW